MTRVLVLLGLLGIGCDSSGDDKPGDDTGPVSGDDTAPDDTDTDPGDTDSGDTDSGDTDSGDTDPEVDADADGWNAAADCDDADPTVHPDAPETCDGVDQDCDGDVDEDATGATTWYTDADGDGFGDAAAPVVACEEPRDAVADASDCDDADDARFPGADELCNDADDDCDGALDDDPTDPTTWYADLDGDGYGDPATPTAACTAPAATVADDSDCDDGDAAVNPAAVELCDGVDDDCDGTVDEDDAADASTWYRDADADGHGETAATTVACAAPSGYVAGDGDCDDADASLNPAATDTCYDTVDQDCNGTLNDGCRSYTEHCGTITASETWSGADVHIVTCDVLVAGGSAPVLTIEDGALVTFGAGDRLAVGSSEFGSLVVEGTTLGVTFTSEQATPAPGDWDGIYVGEYNRGVTITGATIEYAGGNGKGNIHAADSDSAGGALTIADSLVRYGSHAGIYLDDDSVLGLSGTTVSDNASHGVYLDTPSALATTDGPTFTDDVITANGGYPVVVPVSSVAQLDATSSFTGNGTDAIYTHAGTLTTDATWQALDADYLFVGDVAVAGSAAPVLTIEDGATLTFNAGVAFSVGSSTYGGLDVQGTTTGVTFTSADPTPTAGDWDGILLGSYARGVTIDGATVEYGGGNGYGDIRVYYSNRNSEVPEITDSVLRASNNSGLWVGDASTVSVTGTDLRDNADYGVVVQSDSALTTFTDNLLTGNGLYPITLPANHVGTLDATSSFTGNAGDYVYITTDLVEDDATWSLLDVPYRVGGELYVEDASDPLLTIADGTAFYFEPGFGLRAGYRTYGALDVRGTTLGVTFTSADATPTPGDWDGLWLGEFDTGTVIDGATVSYGGATHHGNVYLDDNASYGPGAVITDSVISHGGDSGVYLVSDALVDIRGTTIADNDDYGVYLDDSSALSRSGTASFTDNVVTRNGLEPIYLYGNYAYALDDSSTYAGNGVDRIYLVGDAVNADATWQAVDVDWYVASDMTVQGSTSPRLTIDQGATLTFGRGAGLIIASSSSGSLYAAGTAAAPIVFTSAQPVPAAGDWDGLTLGTDDVGSTIAYATVAYGGSNAKGNVYFNSASNSSVVTDSTIAYSSAWGIYRNATTPGLTNLVYVGNTSGELY